ncbi:transmembrane and coiled-coil domain-containing protein 4 [Trichinella spiralis]|uniref:transmembrane and coiled-coil domain-containing protein 4 n=1 Tax=Trichinella spiralis TaxID=6334 RepID=UPI0001EFD708|nr:transmembrane and coiled-coil domain-containing protein 4 [Trichinella spiralis]
MNNSVNESTDSSPSLLSTSPHCLNTNTKLSICNMFANLLHTHFFEPCNQEFSQNTFENIFAHMELPEEINAEMKAMYDRVDLSKAEQFASAIKEDQFWSDNDISLVLFDILILFIHNGKNEINSLGKLINSFFDWMRISGNYDSRLRHLLILAADMLGITMEIFNECENALICTLEINSSKQAGNNNSSTSSKAEFTEKSKKWKRALMIGFGGVVGGTLVGLTGGLATPLLAIGLATLSGSAATLGLATTAGAAVIGSIFGVAGAGWTGYKLKRRFGALEEFTIEILHYRRRSLHIALAVSGWITEDHLDSFKTPWRCLNASNEQYCLRYESKYLLEFGKAIDYIFSVALSCAIQHSLMETALAGVMSAVAWPVGLLGVASVIDNPWNVCIRRSQEVGEQLSQMLLSRQHGHRPVTLLGFSLGARVIYHCLLFMEKSGNFAGIVQNVILLGTPVGCSPCEWKKISQVVGGYIINGYCRSDWLLKFLYRTMNLQYSVAGLEPIENVSPRIQNKDLSLIMNFNDVEIVRAILTKASFEETDNAKEADVVLLMTCAIRQSAEEKIWKRVKQLRKELQSVKGVKYCSPYIGILVKKIIHKDVWQNEVHTRLEVKSGVKEVTLLGQNVNSYCDADPSSTIVDGQLYLASGFVNVVKRKKCGIRFAELLQRLSNINSNRTKAHRRYCDDVPIDVKKARSQQLQNEFRKGALILNRKFIGKTLTVLVEKINDASSEVLKGVARRIVPLSENGGEFAGESKLNFDDGEVVEEEQEKEKKQLDKRIVLLFISVGQPELRFPAGGGRQNCSFNYDCIASNDKRLLSVSSAVIFELRDVQLSSIFLPKRPDQIFIFYSREAPPQLFAPTLGVGNFFDHSVTYMPISWFHCPYGMVVKKKKKKSESSGEESSTRREQQPNNRTRLAFWIASKCSTHSGREWLVERLARYIPIDTYGACGTLPLTREAFDHDQQRSLAKLYKFRIVFENTVCRHYMTERFFEALIDGSVPVVLRRADYEPIAPEHSFIAVDDFHSAQQLADYLNFLHTNPRQYEKYHQWTRSSRVELVPSCVCNLCLAIKEEEEKKDRRTSGHGSVKLFNLSLLKLE